MISIIVRFFYQNIYQNMTIFNLLTQSIFTMVNVIFIQVTYFSIKITYTSL